MDKLKKIFSRVLGVEESSITPETSPVNTPEWDSLRAIVLLTELEQSFGVVFDLDEAMAVKNVEGAAALLRKKGVAL